MTSLNNLCVFCKQRIDLTITDSCHRRFALLCSVYYLTWSQMVQLWSSWKPIHYMKAHTHLPLSSEQLLKLRMLKSVCFLFSTDVCRNMLFPIMYLTSMHSKHFPCNSMYYFPVLWHRIVPFWPSPLSHLGLCRRYLRIRFTNRYCHL